jgi:hypothetical protein
MTALWQIFAIARTEFRFGLRRGWPVIGTAAVGLVVSAGTLYLAFLNMEDMSSKYAAEVGASALAMAWPAFQWLALGVLPIVTAPTIPADRQFGVDELLRSTPLAGSIYLAGKVLGVIAAMLLTATVALVLHILLHLALIGPINLALYLELTFLNGLPLLLWATTIGVLAASGLHSRRLAIFVGILVGVLGPYPWALAFRPPPELNFVPYTSLLSRQAASDFIFQRHNLLPWWVTPVTTGQIIQVYTLTFLTLLIVAFAARLWLRWKENF